MANSCSTNIKYSKDNDYAQIQTSIELGASDLELRMELEQMYGENSSLVDTILEAIHNGEFNENWEVDSPVSNVSPETTPINFNGAQKEENPDISPLSDFYYNREHGYTEIHEAQTKFIDDVLSSVLYNKHLKTYQNPSTENVNSALYDYKLRLLKNLWSATGISHESELDESDEIFNKVINQTILDFGNIATTQTSRYYNDYVILKKFNELLEKFIPFIKINSAYANVSEHGRSMYIWDPSGKYRSNWTDSEESDINKVTSPVVKILLNYIPCVNKNGDDMLTTIGLKTYNTIMSTILTWVHQNKNSFIDVRNINTDIRKHGLSANYTEMLDAYLRHNPNLNEGLADVIRGIRKHILNSDTAMMPSSLKHALINQFFITAKFSYFDYRIVNGQVQGQYLEDGFVNTQRNQLMRSITSRVRILQEEPRLFKNLLKSVGVTVDSTDDGEIEIKLDKRVYGEEVSIKVRKSNESSTVSGGITITDNLEGRLLNDTAVINLIERVLQRNIPSDYYDIVQSMSSDNVIDASLYSIFRNPIAILLSAVEDDKYIFTYNDNSELQSYMYKSYCSDAARFIGIAKGVNELSIAKNGEGNNLPIYQLSPAMFDMFDLIDYYADSGNDIFLTTERLITSRFQKTLSRKTLDNVLEKNPYIVKPELLKRIVARADIKVNNRVKSSDKLSVSEVTNAAIFTDFYSNLIYTPTASENDRKTNRELENCILLQPITFSDKKTHFLVAVNLAAQYINYKNLNGSLDSKRAVDIFRDLTKDTIDPRIRRNYISAIKDNIKLYIGDKVKRQVFNQYARFYAVFKNALNREKYSKYKVKEWDSDNTRFDFETFDAWKAFNEIDEILKEINRLEGKNALNVIRKAFNGVAALDEDFDIRIVGNSLQANETVFYNIQTSLIDNGNFDKFITRNIKNFATSLGEYNIVADLIKNPELRTYFDNIKDKSKWIDSISNLMRSFIVYEDGVKRDFTQSEIEDGALYADNIVVELNPIIEAYFYAHNMYAVPANDLIFGEQANYTPKTLFNIDFATIDPFDERIEEMMASSLSMEFKRTTYGGAVKRRFATGIPFGLPDMIHWSGIDTTSRYVSTIRGETHKAKTQDGNGWVDPIGARMIQGSLIDSPVGDVRKTIFGWTDPRTGAQIHFKWAEDTITTAIRQRNDGDGSTEMMLKKGRNKYNIRDKFKKITDISKYYDPVNKKKYRYAEKVITHTDYIYRYDIENGAYWRLDSINANNGNLETNWTKVSETGQSYKITDSKSNPINNLYDLDLAFGGAWVYDLIDGQMVPSEAVNDILYYIVCEYNMKDALDVYFVGGEACKSGKFNFNSYDKLNVDNNDPLVSYCIRSSSGGVLQNADHDLDFSSVTEMTQMITLLSQGGRNVELVNQMYEDIGRVANEALNSIITNINNEKEIYRILGRSLMDTFNSGNREELGLAQAFIRSAQKALETNGNVDDIILPYSAETVKGSFVAAVTSLINKRGIRRKYAGFGGVEVGAEDIIVHWDVNGRHLTLKEVRDHYRTILKENNITWEQLKTEPFFLDPKHPDDLDKAKLNPSFKKVSQDQIHFGDTVFIRKITRDELGKAQWTYETIRIDTQPQYDKIVALLDPNEWDIFVWQAKSKQLEQSDLRITANGKTFSEYSLDSVRASFYLDELKEFKKYGNGWNDDFIERRKNVLRRAITNKDMSIIPDWNIEDLWNSNKFDKLIPELKKLLNRKTTIYMDKLSKIAKSGKEGFLPTQMIENNDMLEQTFQTQGKNEMFEFNMPISQSIVSPKIGKRIAQIAMGRKNFEKFLLKKGDRLDKIKTEGESFFKKRLEEKATSFSSARRQIKGLRYDGLLQLSNGDTAIVCVGNPKSEKLYTGQDFVSSSDAISYKGKVIVDNQLLKNVGKVTEILTRSYMNPETNQIMPVLIVKDFETFDRLSKSSAVVQHKYNFTKSNWRQILEFDKRKNIDVYITDSETGLSSNTNISGNNHTLISKDDVDTISTIVRLLNRQEHKLNRNKLWNRARVLYRNFLAQLNYLQTRIPSQAMQSTMALEVVDIIDIDTNYLWIPLMTHLFQGSDLDIDKGYCMGYDVDDNGNIFAESDLIFNPDYDVEDIIMLASPNGSTISFAKDGQTPNVSKTELLQLIKEGENNNWKIIDYIKAFNKFTEPNKDILFEDLNLMLVNHNGETLYSNLDINQNNIYETEQASNAYIFSQVTLDYVNQAIDEVNKHNASAYDERRSAGALRNKVFVAGKQIITDPSSQMDHMMPVSLGEARNAANNSSLGKKEKKISIYTPTTIFEMQQQNMTGKTVIPLTATGIKSFFIISTGYNTKVKEAESLLKSIDLTDLKNINDVGTKIAKILNELTFDSIFNPDGENTILRTFANINFDDILEQASNFNNNVLNNIILTESITPTRANENNWNKYVDGDVFRMLDLIKDLDKVANGNIWSPKIKEVALSDGTVTEQVDYEYLVVNAADSLGALLNAAADNAKELVLEKLNANEKFADFYVALLMLGYKFSDIAKEMTSRAFRIVTKYAGDNIFDPSTHGFNTRNAIDFVLDIDDLSCIDRGMFNAYLSNSVNKNGTYKDRIQNFKGFALYLLNNNFVLQDGSTLLDYLKTKLDFSEYSTLALRKLKPITGSIEEQFEVMLTSDKNDKWKSAFARQLINLLKDTKLKTKDGVNVSSALTQLIISHLSETITSISSPNTRVNMSLAPSQDYNYVPELTPDFTDLIEQENDVIDYSSIPGRKYFNGSFNESNLRQLYRYLQLYLIPKNQLWQALTEDERIRANQLFRDIKDKILYVLDEIKIVGAYGSINQGLRVGDYAEYAFVERLNKFVNSAYINRAREKDLNSLKDGEFEEFDLLKFLDDSEKKYHDTQIEQYDKVKAVVNILQAIDGIANFKAMFKYTRLNRNLISRSSAIKFERLFAKEALLYKKDEKYGINLGLRNSFNQDEFKILSRYTRDSIILNFFMRYGKQLSISIPQGVGYYTMVTDGTISPDGKVKTESGKSIFLNNIVDLANFKRLMDTYIIPKLIEDDRFVDNAFIRSLTQDDDARDDFTGKSLTGYRLNIPLINLENEKDIDNYSKVLYWFNQLLYTPVPTDYRLAIDGDNIEQWTIGNLFFIYNLMCYKDRIGGNSMTRLMEDIISSNNKGSLPALYYRYLNNLDRNLEDIYNDNGEIDSNKFLYDIRDLLYRLSASRSAKSKFDVIPEFNGKHIFRVNVAGEGIDTITDQRILSDFVFGMPFATKFTDLSVFKPAKNLNGFNKKIEYKYNSLDVFDAFLDAIHSTYGKDLPIIALEKSEIAEQFKKYTPEQIEQLQNSKGFIIDGTIYLNRDKDLFSLDTPIHEIMHFIAAGMKFNSDPNIKNIYYKLLDNVVSRVQNPKTDEERELFDKLNEKYKYLAASDKSEEFLVTLLSRDFQNRFTDVWGSEKIITKQLLQATVRQVLSKILKDDRIKSWNEPGIDFANVSLESVSRIFANEILTMDPKLHSGNIAVSQEMAELKSFLLENGYITLENCL